jgi:hypothetical protein
MKTTSEDYDIDMYSDPDFWDRRYGKRVAAARVTRDEKMADKAKSLGLNYNPAVAKQRHGHKPSYNGPYNTQKMMQQVLKQIYAEKKAESMGFPVNTAVFMRSDRLKHDTMATIKYIKERKRWARDELSWKSDVLGLVGDEPVMIEAAKQTGRPYWTAKEWGFPVDEAEKKGQWQILQYMVMIVADTLDYIDEMRMWCHAV